MKKKFSASGKLVAFLLLLTMLASLFPTAALGADIGSIADSHDFSAVYSKGDELAFTASDDAELTLEKLDLSQNDASGVSEALLAKGVSADGALTRASDAGLTAEEVSYIEAVAEELVDPVGIVDVTGGDNETKYVFVWLQSLPDALERVYTQERMNVRGYDRARSDGRRARGEIRSHRGVHITHEYTEVFSGYALEATMSELEAIAAMDGVFAITEVGYATMDEYKPDPDYTTPGNAGARKAFDLAELHALGWDGTGVKVGVIDSGIDPNHPDLQGAYKGGWNYPANNSNMLAPDLDHGTHVSGIIASQGIISLGMAPGVDLYMAQVFNPAQHNAASQANITAALEDFSKGNAARGIPKVDVVNMSLGNDVETPYSADHFARNNACIAGVMVCVSAGNNAYPQGDTTGQRNNYTLGSGGVSLPISVAASEHGGNPILSYAPVVSSENGEGTLNFYCENGDAALAELDGIFRDGAFGSTETRQVAFNKTSTSDVNFPYPGPTYTIEPLVYIDGKGYELYYACPNNVPTPGGTTGSDMTLAELTALNNMAPGSLIGKILVVNRGQNFYDYKGQALRLGAAGLIVINREDAVIGNLNIGSETSAKDMLIFSAPASFKQTIYDLVQGGKTAYLDPGDINKVDHKLQPAGFSSIGPVNLTAELKPDIIAPGWSVLSTSLIQNLTATGTPASPYTIIGSSYTEMSGTSMSSPCVAGLAALVKQKYPEATPAEIKARLMNTADPFLLGPSDTNKKSEGSYYFNADGTEISVFEQGAGFVNPKRAVLGDDVYITVDNIVPTGNTNQGTMTATMASFSFGQTEPGEITKKLTAVVHGASEYDISIIYNNDTRYSCSSEGAVEVFYEINGDSFDLWLEIDEDVSDSAFEGNLYEGYVIVTAGDEDYVLPWSTRVGEALAGGDWLVFPDRPIQATHNNPDQDFGPYSSRNNIYFSFMGKGYADNVVLRSSGLLTITYYLDFYLINADTEKPAYRYQVAIGTGTILDLLLGAPKLSEFIATDGSVYRVNTPAQAYAINANGTSWATSVSNIAPGSYYVALQFNEGSGNFYDWYLQCGITFSNTRPTLTIFEDRYDEEFTFDDDYAYWHEYAYGTDEVTVDGRLYSAAVDTAANAGYTGFYWCGYYLLYYDAIVPLDQSLNVLVDAESGWELEFFNPLYGAEVPWFCDDDGYFSLTMPVQDSGNFFPYDYFYYGDDALCIVYCADAFDVGLPWDISGTTVTYSSYFMDYGCLASYMWLPLVYEADPEIEVVCANLDNEAGLLTAAFLYQDGEIPEEIDEDLLTAELFVNGEADDVLVFEGYDAETGVAAWSFEPYKVKSYTPLELFAVVTYEQYYIFTEATAADISIHIVAVTADAAVKVLNGNKNDLTVVVTEFYSDGSTEKYTVTVSISNNAIGTYRVDAYDVYVDTKGNDQIRSCIITADYLE